MATTRFDGRACADRKRKTLRTAAPQRAHAVRCETAHSLRAARATKRISDEGASFGVLRARRIVA
eukprot:5744525-Pleurochrysis_carterae.AAC.3